MTVRPVTRLAVIVSTCLLQTSTGSASDAEPDVTRHVKSNVPVTDLSARINLPAPLQDSDFRLIDDNVAELGRLLFFDPLLSGNRNVACSSCHHPSLASADGLSLGIGEGGVGLGPERRLGEEGVKHRVPRHAPALFNLGAREFTTLFHDGRVSIDADEPSGFDTPAEEFLPHGLDSVLAAQALFPLLAEVEMAGAVEENEIAGARRRRADYGWHEIESRLRNTPGYADPFLAAWPDEGSLSALDIRHVGNALAAFMEREWRSDNSPFDQWLSGSETALDAVQQRGAMLFYGKAACSGCHTGALLTDHDFHALALPPLGPGRTRLYDPVARDVGRLATSDRAADAYRFRTPSLRNVAATAPYGHNGSYATLEGVVRHHLDPLAALAAWRHEDAILTSDDALDAEDLRTFDDGREMARYRGHVDIEPVSLDDDEMQALLAFLDSLTDRKSLLGKSGTPSKVPSGLPVD